jgi:hypothetical protein
VQPKSTEPQTKSERPSPTKPRTNGSQKPKPRSQNLGLKLDLSPRKQGALQRLLKNSHVTAKQVQEAPPVEEILASIGSRKKIIEVMRFSAEVCVHKVLKLYDQSPDFDRAKTPLAAFILVAGVNPNELVGAVIMAFRTMQAQKSALMTMKRHPRVVESTIRYANLPEGYRDRQMVHQAVGFLGPPRSGGGGSNINLNFGSPERPPEAKNEDGITAPDINEVFPMISDRLPAWQEARQKALKAKD